MVQNTVYYSAIAAKSAIGIGLSSILGGHTASRAVFLCPKHVSSVMAVRAGELKSSPDPRPGRPTLFGQPPMIGLVGGLYINQSRSTAMNQTISIGHTTELPFVFYKNQPVVTLAMIDAVHARKEGTARYRFRDNKDRFIEGEDYFFINYSQKGEFRPFGIDVPTRGLTLLTETGYLMLVKSFTDDLAWKIQRQLIKAYFRSKPPEIKTISRDQFLELRRIVSSISNKLPGKQSVEWHMWKRVRDMFGVKTAMDLPYTEFLSAQNMLLQLKATTDEFMKEVEAVQKRFCKEVLLVDGEMDELSKELEKIH